MNPFHFDAPCSATLRTNVSTLKALRVANSMLHFVCLQQSLGGAGRLSVCFYLILTAVLHRNSSQWSDLWVRGDDDSERLEKHPLEEQLRIKKVKSSDEGTYKVLDEHGLAVSTVQLSVEGERLLDVLVHQLRNPHGMSVC